MKVALLILQLAQPPVTADYVQELLDSSRFDEAEQLLKQLPEPAQERLGGLLALEREEPAKAASLFQRAHDRSPDDARLCLYLSHARLLNNEPEAALKATTCAEPLARDLAYVLLRARSLAALDRSDEAYNEMAAAHDWLGAEPALVFELARLAQSFGLERASLNWAQMVRSDDRPHVLGLFHVYYGVQAALPLLELYAAAWSKDAELQGHLATAYAACGQPRIAARQFRRAQVLGADAAFDAAEQFRVVGDYEAALRSNAQVKSNAKRSRQRLAILFDRGSYARVVASGEPLTAADRYRFAYAYLALGQRNRAVELARTLLDGDYAGPAKQLLDAAGYGP